MNDSLLQLVRGEAGPQLTEREMLDELMGLMGAGHHTTATALTWAFGQRVRHRSHGEAAQRHCLRQR